MGLRASRRRRRWALGRLSGGSGRRAAAAEGPGRLLDGVAVRAARRSMRPAGPRRRFPRPPSARVCPREPPHTLPHTHGFSAKPALPRRRRRGRARGPRVARERVAAMASSRDRAASQVPDSVLLVVQSYPVSSLAHDQVMHRLRSAKWPVTLRFSRPLTDNDVTPLARCLQLEQQGELPDDLKLQMLKRLLSKGVAVRKHGSRTVWKSKFHGAFDPHAVVMPATAVVS